MNLMLALQRIRLDDEDSIESLRATQTPLIWLELLLENC